ncbi:MAG: helix-turn-helix domain-containing protein [Bdellovibrionales bacterium]
MKATGNILKQRRESLKISIAEVSIATKITPRMVQAIESGDMEMLPARTFLRGFVKSYATFLKMDLDAVLKSFAEEMAALEPPPPPPPGSEEAAGRNSPSGDYPTAQEAADARTGASSLMSDGMSMTKKTSLGLGLAVLIAVIVFVYKMVDKYEREGRVEQPPPTLTKIEEDDSDKKSAKETAKPPEVSKPDAAKPNAVVKHAEPTKPVEATKPVVETPKPPVAAIKPPEAAKPAEIAKPVDTPKLPIVAVKPPEVVKPPETSKPAEPTKPAEPPKKTAAQEIIIEALDKVEIVFRVNGGQEKKVTLQPDQYHTIKATGALSIDLSDGGAVNVIQNGRDMGVPGDLGRPKKLQFP